ncbi:MAG TPA: MerR family transcriptional regulator [Brevundimonas sp.]|jgi:hypothetical protein|uniref:MerR family transcriptional regulator n=1 Tax=Brevundimonas sp. TaxID=1871086 RepID=UPI002DEE4525|nr:MerR family transcriptional regulator [Brevundimonas sp.]
MAYSIMYTQFSAADAARITGVSQDEQRDWRKRGFLPPIDGGKAKFDVKLLAGMLAAKKLQGLGIAPTTGWALARSCGAMIYTRIMNRRHGVLDLQELARGPLVQTSGQSDVMARWAIADDERTWGYADDAASLADQIGAASAVLDLDRLARELVQDARRPVASIEPSHG